MRGFLLALLFAVAAQGQDDFSEIQAKAHADLKEQRMSEIGEAIRKKEGFVEKITVKLLTVSAGMSGRSNEYYYPRLRTLLRSKGEEFLSEQLLQPFGKDWSVFTVSPWIDEERYINSLSVGIGEAYSKSGKRDGEYFYDTCLMYGYLEKLIACGTVALTDVAKNAVTKVELKLKTTGESATIELIP